MKLSCPHCDEILELTPEALASFEGDSHFPCPVCEGEVPLPEPASPPDAPKRTGRRTPLLPKTGGTFRKPASKTFEGASPAAPEDAVVALSRGLNRNLLVLGTAVLLLLGGAAIYLALTTKGDTHQTREERIREIVRNQYFTDLIASGATTRKELLALWDIRPYGVGYVGLSGKTGAWEEAADLAAGVGATVLKLDPPDAAARTALLDWLAEVTEDLGGESHWLLDHGEAKAVSAPVVNRVTTMDRPRRVLLHWEAQTTAAP